MTLWRNSLHNVPPMRAASSLLIWSKPPTKDAVARNASSLLRSASDAASSDQPRTLNPLASRSPLGCRSDPVTTADLTSSVGYMLVSRSMFCLECTPSMISCVPSVLSCRGRKSSAPSGDTSTEQSVMPEDDDDGDDEIKLLLLSPLVPVPVDELAVRALPESLAAMASAASMHASKVLSSLVWNGTSASMRRSSAEMAGLPLDA